MDKATPTKILVLGGGFAGVYSAVYLDKLCKNDPSIEVTLISQTNYFLMTPLLFEAGSGVLEPRHSVNPIRQMFSQARFIQGRVESIDIAMHEVGVRLAHDRIRQVSFDHLVLALGGVTNTKLIAGSEHALQFKTLADAIFLRNHTIQRFERADVEDDAQERARQLTFVIVGAGLVGVELVGELTDFVEHVGRIYPRVDRSRLRFELIEAGPRIIPEFDETLSAYAAQVLADHGVKIRTGMRVRSIEPGHVHLEDGTDIAAETIVLTAGAIPHPLLASLALPKDRKGRVQTDGTMAVPGHSGIWALGDCASIPDPTGKPYPPLAQHAIREARTLAGNVVATIKGNPVRPFIYKTQGSLAALGHYRGVGRVWGIPVKGFIAWWIWRTYYLFRMPRWERRIRIMLDWAIALFFKNDVVELDLNRASNEPYTQSGQGDRSIDTRQAVR